MNPEINPNFIKNPFKHFCMNVGYIPTSYKECMDYYETLLWLIKFLETRVIPAIDNNAAALTELQGLFIELKNYVDHYFDNLDVQDEINNKLDEMVESGTLQEIIAEYLNSKAVFGFDNVASMKEATNLIDGSYAKTLGYHTKGDGGSALYKIRSITNADVVDEASIISLQDENLIAELIIENELNIMQLGAYGDNIHDDSSIIQYAIDLNVPLYFPNKTYLLNSTLNFNNKGNDNSNYNFNAENAKFNYTGNEYAISLRNVQNANFNIGYLISNNGGNIKMYATGNNDFIQYLNMKCKVMKSNSEFANVYGETTGDGWINEVVFSDGRIYGSSKYGFHLKYGCNSWKFNNIGFEGCDTGVYFQNTNAENHMRNFTFFECRHQESIEKYLVAEGIVKDVYIYYSRNYNFYLIDTNSNCTNWRVYDEGGIGSILIDGIWFFNQTLKTLEGGYNVPDNTDLNNLTMPGDYNFTKQSVTNTASHLPHITGTLNIQGKLTVEKFSNYLNSGDTAIVQTYITKTGEIFTRCYASNTWSVWNKNNYCSVKFATNDDLNNCNDVSYYSDNATITASLSNKPTGVSNVFRLDVIPLGAYNGTRYAQRIIDHTGNVFIRVYDGSSFTTWKQINLV